MTFLDTVLFPTELSYGSQGGPRFGNVVQVTPQGRIGIVQRVDDPPMAWSISFKHDAEATAAILSLARIAQGSLNGFRFIDFLDFSTATDHQSQFSLVETSHRHLIGVGDGTTTRFPLSKTYSYGSHTKVRRIRKPLRLAEAQQARNIDFLNEAAAVSDVHAVWLGGVSQTIGATVSIDYETGELVFGTAPGSSVEIHWAGYFAVPVRFGQNVDEQLRLITVNYAQREFDSIDLVEDTKEMAPLVAERYPGGASRFVSVSGETVRTISFADGLLIEINPDAATASPLPVRLPAITAAILGGPLFHILNIGSTDSLAVQTSAGAAVLTIGPGQRAEFWAGHDGSGGYVWSAV